jgi:hypothetical protein
VSQKCFEIFPNKILLGLTLSGYFIFLLFWYFRHEFDRKRGLDIIRRNSSEFDKGWIYSYGSLFDKDSKINFKFAVLTLSKISVPDQGQCSSWGDSAIEINETMRDDCNKHAGFLSSLKLK